MTSPYVSASAARGFESFNPIQTNIEYDDSFETINLKDDISSKAPLMKEKNSLICLAFSRTMNNIKDLFSILETRIASSMEKFQIARQQERIRQLEERSDFHFDVLAGNSESVSKDSLDIQEALLHATLSKNPQPIYIDSAGKLCNFENSVLVMRFNPGENCFWAFPGNTVFSRSPYLVNGKPIFPQTLDELEKGSFQLEEYFFLTKKNGESIAYIDIHPNQKLLRTEKAHVSI